MQCTIDWEIKKVAVSIPHAMFTEDVLQIPGHKIMLLEQRFLALEITSWQHGRLTLRDWQTNIKCAHIILIRQNSF